MLANPLSPPRREPAYAVEIRYWRPRRKPETFDVTMPCGLVLRGCSVYVRNLERRVKAPGFEFATPGDEERFKNAVLAALDAEGGAR